MSRITLTLLAFAFTLTQVLAQLIVEQDSFVVEGNVSESFTEQVFSMYNESTEATGFYWSIEVDPDFPSSWYIGMCDLITCLDSLPAYKSQCPAGDSLSARNILGAEVTYNLFSLKVIPGRTKGRHKVTWNFMKYCNDSQPSELIESVDFIFNVTGGTATEDVVLLADTHLSPNPTSGLFNILNDQDVQQVSLYDLVGRKLAAYRHTPNNTYDVSGFQKGLYYVRLENKEKGAYRTMRLLLE